MSEVSRHEVRCGWCLARLAQTDVQLHQTLAQDLVDQHLANDCPNRARIPIWAAVTGGNPSIPIEALHPELLMKEPTDG